MTIGNIPKELRRKPSKQAQVLIGYLPTTSLTHITQKASRRRTVINLFHACMKQILKPLVQAGIDGVAMQSGDGKWRRCHPILAAFVGDYPEQILVACVKKGECAVCCIPAPEVGESMEVYGFRNLNTIRSALDTASQGPTEYSRACRAVGIKPVQQPFWEDLPFTNIYHSITPDILHQLYQGMVKHVVSWLREAVGDDELDAQCR